MKPSPQRIPTFSNSTTTPDSALSKETVQERIEQLNHALNGILLGKETQTKLSLACLFGRGHLLIEDLPGMGKTLLSHALARVLGLELQPDSVYF